MLEFSIVTIVTCSLHAGIAVHDIDIVASWGSQHCDQLVAIQVDVSSRPATSSSSRLFLQSSHERCRCNLVMHAEFQLELV
jgi:hypothetical protein